MLINELIIKCFMLIIIVIKMHCHSLLHKSGDEKDLTTTNHSKCDDVITSGNDKNGNSQHL